MKIAYLISAYKLPQQLIRLVERLNTPETTFIIHVDKKTDVVEYENLKASLKSLPNLTFLPRHKCYWGGFGHVKASLSGIDYAISEAVDFDYMILLTGQCYPIKSNEEISQFLENSSGKSFINYFIHSSINWDERIFYWHIRQGKYHFVFPKENMFENPDINRIWNRFVKLINLKRKFPMNFTPYFGGSYWCLSNDALKFIHNFVHTHPNYLRYFKTVFIPDEIFFQTILVNSNYRDNLVNDDLRYIDFTEHKANPKILTRDDFHKFIPTRKLFARKFDMTVDKEVLDMIDNEII